MTSNQSNLNQSTIDQAIALAGITQSIRVVQHIAWKGQTNETDFKAVIASLLKIESSSAISVYNGSFELSTGLRTLKQQLDTTTTDKDPEFVGLVINLLTLHKQLTRQPKIMEQLGQSIENLAGEFSNQDIYDDEVFQQLLARCSQIYKNTLSKLPNRIQVKGEPKHLKPDANQQKVRCALLCAMRSVFLWRQSGGTRWHFLFKKKTILEAVENLLSQPRKE
ncbi:MAG: high frequency lysogenization protein HflD [Kangiellaceae bacterium]|nr:high frequency lysogenization protein HflD [Kangiellaceae bacterium]